MIGLNFYMVKIAFRAEEINVRGTTVALYDYAKYNQEILHNQSIIVMEQSAVAKSDPLAMANILCHFDILTYNNLDHLERILQQQKCDILYCIKYGKNDQVFSSKIKTVIHCVFDMSEPHGDVYAGVSNVLAKKYHRKLFVPHMIGLKPSETKENLRSQLHIPDSAIVFGRYGGLDTFNIGFCWQAISNILNSRSDIYFLFINTPQIVKHPRIKYLDKVVTEEDKNKFICTCDAYLECGTLGHSFGLAIGEFSVNNKPIIAYKGNLWNTAHLDILQDKGLYFTDYDSFYRILNTFDRQKYTNQDLNCYKNYMPEPVMKIFDDVFIKRI